MIESDNILKVGGPARRKVSGLAVGAATAFLLILVITAISGTSPSPRNLLSKTWHTTQGAIRPDTVDGFQTFKQTPQCSLSSGQLHQGFARKCEDRESLLEAMSGGGRIGFDAPYTTLGCDMRWFSVSEICSILHRFDRIYIIGDNMVRQLAQALHVLMREDLVSGARATWRSDDPPGFDCHCRSLWTWECEDWVAANTDAIWEKDPTSIRCSEQDRPASVSFQWLAQWPLAEETVQAMVDSIDARSPPDGRQVFIFGHGVWNEFDPQKTVRWILQLENAMRDKVPSWFETGSKNVKVPRLFVGPTAQGERKHRIFAEMVNNIRLMKHEHGLPAWLNSRGYDYLGLYNLTVQASSPDGTHASMETGLMKAMMVLNWLSMLKLDD